ncbi:tetratricopeptide repeat protein 39B isoform X2 [Drosophila busckii]|uniref:tetratricopeptide repeat protein 39B isoform X2 n=1 Tax=Drosophila busckii TaxID=30019 RepID=UPI00083F3000|nr:tetratricopeptide repeat protein 39B isoform X2 [Drosophila busckii]
MDIDDSSSEEYFDACSYLDVPPVESSAEMDLSTSLEEAKLAINFFFDNRFEEARTLLKPHANQSLYHSMGMATFSFLEAILTFDHIDNAAEELKKCVELCQRLRKKSTLTESISNTFKKKNFNLLTDLECHAELCLAEVLLMRALLTFLEDENLSGLIRGSLQNTGLKELQKGYQENGLRQILCALSLLGFHLMVVPMLSERQCLSDLDLCDKIVMAQLSKFPNGVWMLFFKGRLELIKGDMKAAEHWYIKSWKSQDVWPQFHHISFWELFWLLSMQCKWSDAQFYARELLEKSNWSRSIYAYQLAAVKLMSDPRSTDDIHQIEDLMQQVPNCRQRIAGKSLPMEKFMAKRALRYGIQQGKLVLPLIELMYLWNMFKFIGKHFHIADGVLRLIDTEFANFQASIAPSSTVHTQSYYADNRALCLLLRGACYAQMGKPSLALQDLNECMAQNGIKEDHFILPYANVEAAFCHADNNRQLAIAMLIDTKKKYSNFALESRLHFKIHAALLNLTKLKSEAEQ